MATTTLPLADSTAQDTFNSTPRRPSRPQIDTGLAVQSTTNANIVDDEPDMLFHNYLRAFYDFDPHASLPADEEALQMTASIRAGDLILVHTIHANGWADGTVLTTGIRGWLPTNYCEPYDHSYLRNLLNALCQFWDLLGGSEEANLSTFVRQDYIRGLIAGVRYLLEHADCLHRDSPLVQKHTGIRRMRKGLLADLSSLVQLAKRLQETISEPFTEEVVHGLLDDLMTRAFKVVTRAVGFVDIWTQESGQFRPTVQEDDLDSVATPVDSAVEVEVGTTFSATPKASFDHTRHPSRSEASVSEDVSPTTTTDPRRLSTRPPRPASRSFRARPGSVAHRVSVIASSSSPMSGSEQSGVLASQQLAQAHDLCISHIGAFIGHHLHSHTSSDLANTTENLVKACQKLLAIMQEVCFHDPKGFVSVQPVRDAFQAKIAEAERSTRDVFRFFDSEDGTAVMLPNTSNHLVTVGTDLIRISAECVAKIRSMIEQIGDFELSHPPSPMLGQEQTSSPHQATESSTTPEKQRENRMSSKALPPPPPIHTRVSSTIVAQDFGMPSPSVTSDMVSPVTPFSAVASPVQSSGALVKRHSTIRASQTSSQSADSTKSPQTGVAGSGRKGSIGCCSTIESSSARDSAVTTSSETSTRATTPDHAKDHSSLAALNSFASISSLHSHSGNEGEPEVDESQLLQRTHASELMLNKDGQVSGGSLAALVEQLTTHDSAPDATFVSAFYITFRQFATPREFAQALMDRFDYIGDGKAVGGPVRLRVFNVFKNWLESYWSPDADKEALGDIRYFAMHKLKPLLPSAGDRLFDLTKKISDSYAAGSVNSSFPSAIGKSSAASKLEPFNAPEPIVSKSQMNSLRSALSAGRTSTCSITDFEPMELARQVTLMASRIYCDIHAEELVGLEWTKRESDKGKNVRNLCGLNTDLAHVVGDSILAPENAKQRALVIKHWAKVAQCCLELNNYETVMSITCSLNSSVVQRLKRTWQLVSKKTFARLEELNAVVDVSGNYRSLRKRLDDPPVPCVPFLGVYLTDLTFIDAGNPKMRELPGGATDTGAPISVINFDKHMRTAKIINHVQRFQVPYKLQAVPDMQAWIEMHMERMRACHDQMVTNFHRRSLVIEPKMDEAPSRLQTRKDSIPSIASTRQGSISSDQDRPKTPAPPSAHPESAVREKFGTFFKGNAFAFITTSSTSHSTLPSPVREEVAMAK